MECAVQIRDDRDLDGTLSLSAVLDWEKSTAAGEPMRNGLQQLLSVLGDVAFTRVVFGAEFCEHLLPSSASLRRVLGPAGERKLAVTFAFPYMGERGLTTAAELLEILAADGEHEVIFSDWGLLRLMRREFPLLRPVQGRLLNRALRDPRIMSEIVSHTPQDSPQLAALKGSTLDNSSYQALLRRFGVTMAGYDPLPQGVEFADGVAAMLYAPVGIVSTSRVCPAAGLGYAGPDKFEPAAPCRRECQTHLAIYTYTNSPFANRNQQFFSKGNSYFYFQAPDAATISKAARLVIEPRLPQLAPQDERTVRRSRPAALVEIAV